jgi:hypothetical protein
MSASSSLFEYSISNCVSCLAGREQASYEHEFSRARGGGRGRSKTLSVAVCPWTWIFGAGRPFE